MAVLFDSYGYADNAQISTDGKSLEQTGATGQILACKCTGAKTVSSGGKFYMEFLLTLSGSGGIEVVLGIDNDELQQPGSVADSYGWFQKYSEVYRDWVVQDASYSTTGSDYIYDGDVFMMAVDLDNGKMWWGYNGVWCDSGNPATGANPAVSDLGTYLGTYACPCVNFVGSSRGDDVMTIQAIAGTFSYTVPSGFDPWDDSYPPIVPDEMTVTTVVPKLWDFVGVPFAGKGWEKIDTDYWELDDPDGRSSSIHTLNTVRSACVASRGMFPGFRGYCAMDYTASTSNNSTTNLFFGFVYHVDDGGTFDESLGHRLDTHADAMCMVRLGHWIGGTYTNISGAFNMFPNGDALRLYWYIDSVNGEVWVKYWSETWGTDWAIGLEPGSFEEPFGNDDPFIRDSWFEGKVLRPAWCNYYADCSCGLQYSTYDGQGTQIVYPRDITGGLPYPALGLPYTLRGDDRHEAFAFDLRSPYHDPWRQITDAGRTMECMDEASGATASTRATLSRYIPGGKFYFEVYLHYGRAGNPSQYTDGDPGISNIGFVVKGSDPTGDVSSINGCRWAPKLLYASKWGDYTFNFGSGEMTFADDTAFMVAVDCTTIDGMVWFGYDGVWLESGDPAAGTSPAFWDLFDDPLDIYDYLVEMHIVVSIVGETKVTINARAEDFVHTPPTGFSELDLGDPPVVMGPEDLQVVNEMDTAPLFGDYDPKIDATRWDTGYWTKLFGLKTDKLQSPSRNTVAGERTSFTSVLQHTSGKYYFELQMFWVDGSINPFASSYFALGVVGDGFVFSNGTIEGNTRGETPDSWAVDTSGRLYHDDTFDSFTFVFDPATSHVVGCAVDLDTGKLWFRHGAIWQDIGSGTGDPETGANPCFNDPDIANRELRLYVASPGAYWYRIFRLAVHQDELLYSPPTGFDPWEAPVRSTMIIRSMVCQTSIERPTLEYNERIEIAGNLVIDTIKAGWSIHNAWGDLQIGPINATADVSISQSVAGTLAISGVQLQSQVSTSMAVEGNLDIPGIRMQSSSLVMTGVQGNLAIGPVKVAGQVGQFEPITAEFAIGNLAIKGKVTVGTGQEQRYTLTNKRRGKNWEQLQ